MNELQKFKISPNLKKNPNYKWTKVQKNCKFPDKPKLWMNTKRHPNFKRTTNFITNPNYEGILNYKTTPSFHTNPNYERTLNFKRWPNFQWFPNYKQTPNFKRITNYEWTTKLKYHQIKKNKKIINKHEISKEPQISKET